VPKSKTKQGKMRSDILWMAKKRCASSKRGQVEGGSLPRDVRAGILQHNNEHHIHGFQLTDVRANRATGEERKAPMLPRLPPVNLE